MQFSSTFVGLFVVATAVQAQAPPAVTASASTPLKVTVGENGKLAFNPSNIIAPVGSKIEFSFFPKNHSVTQSSFKDPCHPLSSGGFFSGFVPTKNSPSGTTFTVTVENTTPIWFYCSQTTGSHCQAGMVGSINAPATVNTLQAFIGLAKNASSSTVPAGGPVGGILSVSNSTSTISTSSAISSSSTSVSSSAVTTSAIVSTYTSGSQTYTTTLGSSTIYTVSSTVGVSPSSSSTTTSTSTSSGSPQVTGNSASSRNANLLGVAAVVFGAMAMA